MSTLNNKNYNIGIVLPRTADGGHFQLALSIADSLLKYSHVYNYKILYYDEDSIKWIAAQKEIAGLIPVSERTSWQRICTYINILFRFRLLPMSNPEQLTGLKDAGIKLLIVPFPGLFGFMNDLPYIICISSLPHKYYPKPPIGPPLKTRFVWNTVVKNASKYSVLSTVDSERGMEDLNKYYGVSKDKIRIIPHIPSGYIYENRDMDLETADKILDKVNLPDKFIFYPAQFVNGKNHIRLLNALKLIEQQYKIKIPLVLAGSVNESYKDVMETIKSLKMVDQVVYPGYVSDKEIAALYKKAAALVYPSLFGPTNLPPLEAMIMGTPVACSNLFAMPEQVGDAALLFDPFSIEDIAEKIRTIWVDENLSAKLIKKGYEKIKDLTQHNYAMQWERTIQDALDRIQ
jgi:glycosyltransferase involved in cell wall biosynthesis